MTLFVDASALVAIIAGEDDADRLIAAIEADSDPLWSALSCWETVAALRYSKRFAVNEATAIVDAYASARPFRLIPIGDAELRLALDAYARYGKGSGDAARLNMGDCFAYGCARAHGARLLYKGDDFALTDLA